MNLEKYRVKVVDLKQKRKKKKGEINQTKLELSSCRFEDKRDFEGKNEKRTCE
jgi:hypothetical protein